MTCFNFKALGRIEERADPEGWPFNNEPTPYLQEVLNGFDPEIPSKAMYEAFPRPGQPSYEDYVQSIAQEKLNDTGTTASPEQ